MKNFTIIFLTALTISSQIFGIERMEPPVSFANLNIILEKRRSTDSSDETIIQKALIASMICMNCKTEENVNYWEERSIEKIKEMGIPKQTLTILCLPLTIPSTACILPLNLFTKITRKLMGYDDPDKPHNYGQENLDGLPKFNKTMAKAYAWFRDLGDGEWTDRDKEQFEDLKEIDPISCCCGTCCIAPFLSLGIGCLCCGVALCCPCGFHTTCCYACCKVATDDSI